MNCFACVAIFSALSFSVVAAKERVQVRDKTSTSKQQQHPSELEVEVRTLRGVTNLRLRRNDNIDLNVPVFYGGQEESETEVRRDLSDHAAYDDRRKRSYFTVRSVRREDGSYKRTLSGTLTLSNGEYRLEPENETGSESGIAVRSAEDDGSESESEHIMVKKATGSRFHDQGALDLSLRHVRRGDNSSLMINKRSWGKKNFGVKLLVVLDYSTYRFWKKEKDTERMLRKYFSHIVHGMDMMYDGIDERDFSIYVRMAGFYIAKRGSDSSFTDSRRQRGNKNREAVHADSALEDIRNWDHKMRKSKFRGLKYDHLMVFTALDIFSGGSDATAGLAYTKSTCKTSSQSIVEDHGGFNSVGTAAHELGHSLGAANHDGTGDARGRSCRPESQYIMTAVSGLVKEQDAENPFTFSRCSVQQFRDYLVTNGNGKCLLVLATHEDRESFREHTKNPPGQMYGPEQQCQQIYGQQSFYCASQERAPKICRELWCWDARRRNCVSRGGAIRGTTCGDKKWCERGRCRANRKAPSADATCVHGDYGPPLSGTKHCDQLVKEDSTLCDAEHNRKLCCRSCKDAGSASGSKGRGDSGGKSSGTEGRFGTGGHTGTGSSSGENRWSTDDFWSNWNKNTGTGSKWGSNNGFNSGSKWGSNTGSSWGSKTGSTTWKSNTGSGTKTGSTLGSWSSSSTSCKGDLSRACKESLCAYSSVRKLCCKTCKGS